jgi:ligand-binding sensor domain-containing protein
MSIGRVTLRLFFLLLLLPGWQPAGASDYQIKSWGVDDGMAQSSVTDIAQTPDGYIWIGTLLSGLSRFDGQRFVNYDTGNTPGLLTSGIRRLLVDGSGTLWINDTENNLLQWRASGCIAVGAPAVKLGSLLRERPGSITFVTLAGELLDGELSGKTNWTWQLLKPPVPNAYYYQADAGGTIWFRAPGSKLGRVVNNQYQILEHPAGLDNRQIFTIAKDEVGKIWVGTDAGIFFWTGKDFTNATPCLRSRIHRFFGVPGTRPIRRRVACQRPRRKLPRVIAT